MLGALAPIWSGIGGLRSTFRKAYPLVPNRSTGLQHRWMERDDANQAQPLAAPPSAKPGDAPGTAPRRTQRPAGTRSAPRRSKPARAPRGLSCALLMRDSGGVKGPAVWRVRHSSNRDASTPRRRRSTPRLPRPHGHEGGSLFSYLVMGERRSRAEARAVLILLLASGNVFSCPWKLPASISVTCTPCGFRCIWAAVRYRSTGR